jgi:hypothetical protein
VVVGAVVGSFDAAAGLGTLAGAKGTAAGAVEVEGKCRKIDAICAGVN